MKPGVWLHRVAIMRSTVSLSFVLAMSLGLTSCARCYYGLGVYKESEGDFAGAADEYTKAIESDPSYAEAYYDRANALRHLSNINSTSYPDDTKSAIADYTKAIELSPDYLQAYWDRGTARRDLGEKQQAATDYSTAAKLLRERAVVEQNQGNKEAAFADQANAKELEDQANSLQFSGSEDSGYRRHPTPEECPGCFPRPVPSICPGCPP